MRLSARSKAACDERRDSLTAARAWLEQAFEGRSGEVCEQQAWFGRASKPNRRASLQAAHALALGSSGSAHVARLCRALVREQRADGGFDAQPSSAVSDAATTALSVEVLCAEHARSGGLGDMIARASERLAAGEPRPDVVRALVAVSRSNAVRDGLDAVRRTSNVLESDFDTHALRSLAVVPEAADRLHAWHAAAAVLGLDMRRHPAVLQCTLALIQRIEASAGELFSAYTKEGRSAGRRADTRTAARVALALFTVHDEIVGPRAAFAAELVLETVAARARAGAVRANASRFSPRSVTATAHFVEALHLALARAEMPWALPRASADVTSSTLARRA